MQYRAIRYLFLAIAVSVAPPTRLQAHELPAQLGDLVNDGLVGMGADFQVSMLETYGTVESMGATIAFNDRDKKSSFHFVADDPRAPWSVGDSIVWATDGTEAETSSGLSSAESTAALRRAMQTWDDVPSTDIPLEYRGAAPFDVGVIQYFASGATSGSPLVVGDVVHAGFLDAGFFEALEPGGGSSILGAAFTFSFRSESGDRTDINSDGKLDVAFREIYYNDGFNWTTDAQLPGFDLESVALHEAGHALSQNHFGKGFFTPMGQGQLAPKAVMNAWYTGVQRELQGTDIGGHSSIWASWPNGLQSASSVPEPSSGLFLLSILATWFVRRSSIS